MQLTVLLFGAAMCGLCRCDCDYGLSTKCPNLETIPESGLLLPKVTNIHPWCSDTLDMFECAETYLGDCHAMARLRWQPVGYQVKTLCSSNDTITAYVSSGRCWEDGEVIQDIDDCNQEVVNSLTGDPVQCSVFDEYVQCLQHYVGISCNKDASKVIRDLAESYLVLIRRAVNCSTTTPTPATTTQAVTDRTTHVKGMSRLGVVTIDTHEAAVTTIKQTTQTSTTEGPTSTTVEKQTQRSYERRTGRKEHEEKLLLTNPSSRPPSQPQSDNDHDLPRTGEITSTSSRLCSSFTNYLTATLIICALVISLTN